MARLPRLAYSWSVASRPIPTTLKNVVDTEDFEEIGGHRYLAELAGANFAVINVQDYMA